jgi:exodeoxyribonuclease V beta subunit
MSAPVPFHLTDTPLERGISLIEASAGTGKTFTITALFVRLIVEENLSAREILAVTYTEAATEELRDRVRRALVQAHAAFATGKSKVPYLQTLVEKYSAQSAEMRARLQNALGDFDETPIFTIHGFCQRTLRDRAFESGLLFDTELATDPAEFLQEIADDFWRKQFYEAGPVRVAFALKNRIGPDSFLNLLKTCGNHPQIEFLSSAGEKSFATLSAELENFFLAAKETWLADAAQIKLCFGSAIKWGNKPYNNDADMAELFTQLDTAFSESDTAFECLSALDEFRSSSLAEKKKAKGKEAVPSHRFFDYCEQLGSTEADWLAALQLAFVNFAKAELPRRKAERKLQHFDDLLTRLDAALSGPGGAALAADLQKRYRAALIDEFQDTDPVQYAIFKRAFAGRDNFLFLIGDPKQAIYGFRGADIFTYLQASGEAQRRFTLGENWRSESGLVTAVNRFFDAAPGSFVFDRIEFQPAKPSGQADKEPFTLDGKKEPSFQLWFLPRNGAKEISKAQAEEQLPHAVADEIIRLLHDGARVGERRLKPEDIAVLVLTNAQAAQVQTALAAANIPCVLHTTASLFASPEAEELRRVLAGIAQPGDERRIKAALVTELFGVDGARLAGCPDAEWNAWLQTFHDYFELWQREGFFRLFRQWLQQQQVRQRLLAFPDGERRLTNLLHLGEVLHQAETAQRLGVNGLLKWLAEQMCRPGEAPEEHQLRLERDDNAVRIVTVHKSKGLEYPVTFCLFAWKSSEGRNGGKPPVLFHDESRKFNLVCDLGPEIADAHQQQAGRERLAENVRLFYVALTRASHRCYFPWGAVRDAGTSAPAWLLHRPQIGSSDGGVAATLSLESLAEHFKSLPEEALRADLESLNRKSDGAVAVADLPAPVGTVYRPETGGGDKLACREFTGRIRRDWVISSFTYFTAGLHEEQPDRDAVSAPVREETPGQGMFAFPRGAKAGTCLHEILEKIAFDAADEALAGLVNSRLQAHGLDTDENREAVRQMLPALMKFPLASERSDFTLSKIGAADRLNELEFYFPIQNMSAGKLQEWFGKRGWASTVSAQLERLAFDSVQGFLKGFMDLVFQFEGRFFIVDWKSNWLGNRLEDYSADAIREEMRRQHYFIQYHLYTVALHKYLALRVPGYDYEKHFGGVIYLFLRGIDPAHLERGAFRDRPSRATVEQLAALLEDK